jgi:hypothetical protein
MSITCTISGVSVTVGNASFSLQDPLENRSILTFTVLDSAGTAIYTRGQPVTFSDPGILSYVGYVQSDAPTKDGLVLPYVEHIVTCMDGQYLLDKRSNSVNYLNWIAGNIVVDFVRRDLANEGITISAAMRHDTTVSDFNQGNLDGTVGAINTTPATTLNGVISTTDDGDLEIAGAGSNLTISESTTAQFAAGTLTNVAASNNALSPSTVSALSFTATLPVALATNNLYMEIWSGSQVVGTNDTLNYDIWISSTSPAFNAGVDLNFSDSTSLNTYVGPTDDNTLAASPTTDLSGYAKDTWYTRSIALGTVINGKTVNSVCVAVAGNSAGTYNIFFKNIYLGSHSGSPFFSTSATATQVNPSTVFSNATYPGTLASTSVVQAISSNTVNRVSSAYSIDAVKLTNSTFITWDSTSPSNSLVQMSVSYDGNAFLLCTNGAPLPGLPAGSNVAGTSLYLQEIFVTGITPTAFPSLSAVTVTLTTAPNATKSDVTTSYGTSAQWNAGTLTGVAPNANGDLTLLNSVRTWNDNLITNQTFFPSSGGSPTQSASGGTYNQIIPGNGSFPGFWALSRMDFIAARADFSLDVDTTFAFSGSGTPVGKIGIVYRGTGWSSADQNYAYVVLVTWTSSPTIEIGYGSNSSGGSTGTYTLVKNASVALGTGSNHLKIVVSGKTHQVFWAGSSSPILTATDSTYMSAGQFGIITYGDDVSATETLTGKYDNLVVSSNIGTWQSGSVSLAALTTIEGSNISWLETLATGVPSATAIVSTSIDGGTTWKPCTNNAPIPQLLEGTNVSSLSLIARIILFSATYAANPVIGGLNWRVLGAFPTVTGTRDTAPLGNDMQITRTVGSGWGNAFDSQTWTQAGTGATAVATGEATITNTTGTVYMRLGTRTGTNIQGTHRFSLSSSAETAGIFLRYVDTNNYYALAATTSTTSILKRLAGVTTTLASVSMALSINTPYQMHFLTANSGPVSLFGNMWADGSLEPTVNSLGQWNDSLWVITALD